MELALGRRRSAAPRFQIDSSDAFHMSFGRRLEELWNLRRPYCPGNGLQPGEECGLGKCGPRDDLITYKPRWPVQFLLITHVPSEHLTHVHWSGWSMRCYQLISVCKRLPGWILVVVPVLTISSAASCPWVRVSGYAVVRDQPDHEAAGRISNWTKDYLYKAAVACRVSCMSRRARDDNLPNLVGASSRSPYQGDHEDELCLRGGLGSRR